MLKKLLAIMALSTLGITSIAGAQTDKVLVCHQTSSETNPVVLISISDNAVQAHLDHGDTLLPEGATDCSDNGGPFPE